MNWLPFLLSLFACNARSAGCVKIDRPFPVVWVIWPFPW